MPEPEVPNEAPRRYAPETPAQAGAKSWELPWQTPDRAQFINPWDSRPLLGYYRELLSKYGYVRLMGLPQLKDNPDIAIESLFVEPEFSETQVSPDTAPEQWPRRWSVTEALLGNPRLVVLGDPGRGKTSLLNWLVVQFCRSGASRLSAELGALVPVPIVLREMPLTPDLDWPKLLQLFLNQPVAERLKSEPGLLENLLQRGQVLVMLDGLDELADENTKGRLRAAVLEGILKYPGCRWLMTSRVAGYDRLPFHEFSESIMANTLNSLRDQTAIGSANPLISTALGWIKTVTGIPLDNPLLAAGLKVAKGFAEHFLTGGKLLYLAPFNDRQIEALVRNWYAEREANATVRGDSVRELVKAIHAHPGTLRLARVPNLLTMMALIHRVRARLPQGRVNLYADITEAYLQTIDDFRGLQQTAYTLPQKKLWLARVAFEMQCRRKATDRPEAQNEGILISQAELIPLLSDVIEVPDSQERKRAAEVFLKYLQERTGLFVERSPGQWAFLHLSFQEYFAALFLAEEVTGPDWQSADYSVAGCRPADLQQYAEDPIWRETLVFLFESLGQERPRWSDRVARTVFEKTLLKPQTSDPAKDRSVWDWQKDNDVVLLAGLSVNAYSGFSLPLRETAWAVVWRCSFPTGDYVLENPAADELFSAAPQYLEPLWQVCSTVAKESRARDLNLVNCPKLEDITLLGQVSGLEALDLYHSPVRRGLAALANLPTLHTLVLDWPGALEDPTELTKVVNLNILKISASTDELDLGVIRATLLHLQELIISNYNRLLHCEVLRECSHLITASFYPRGEQAPFLHLKFLPQIKKLRLGTSNSIRRLEELPIRAELDTLEITRFPGLISLHPSIALQKLKRLEISDCDKVEDVTAITEYAELQRVEFLWCPGIKSIEALVDCNNLREIVIQGCENLREIPDVLKSKIV